MPLHHADNHVGVRLHSQTILTTNQHNQNLADVDQHLVHNQGVEEGHLAAQPERLHLNPPRPQLLNHTRRKLAAFSDKIRRLVIILGKKEMMIERLLIL